jgi:tryptophan synthase beta chain
MKLLGATVVPVTSGDQTLRAAIDEALRDWVSDPSGTYYLLGSAVGPHPYPYLVRELQSVIGREARAQMLEPPAACRTRCSPASAAARTRSACSIRSSPDAGVQLVGVEAGGRGTALGDNSATLATAGPACCRARYSMLLQDADGQIQETHSVSAGLDYPGVGPEHALLMAIGRVRYESATDDEALAALAECCAGRGHPAGDRDRARLFGIEALGARTRARAILVCLSGRGDKDMPTLQRTLLK